MKLLSMLQQNVYSNLITYHNYGKQYFSQFTCIFFCGVICLPVCLHVYMCQIIGILLIIIFLQVQMVLQRRMEWVHAVYCMAENGQLVSLKLLHLELAVIRYFLKSYCYPYFLWLLLHPVLLLKQPSVLVCAGKSL